MTAEQARIQQLEDEITKRDNTILLQQNSIKDLQRQVDNLTEIILQMRHDKFGPSSEKTVREDESDGKQLSIFNEVELEADGNVPEPIRRNANGLAPRGKRVRRAEIIEELPIEEMPLEVAAEELICPRCNGEMKPLGKEIVRDELQYIPAKLKIIRYVRYSYECPACKHTDHPVIMKAPVPTSLMNHSLATPSSVAWVMYQKYVQAVPLYRQEKEWERMGLMLSRATMAHWVNQCSERLFFARSFSKKLHPKMENVASPFWRKLQVARQGCQALPKQLCRHINDIAIAL